MDYSKAAIAQAKKLRGKIAILPKVKILTRADLATAYTPGVAAVSLAVAKDWQRAYQLTIKANSVAVVSDGSAVLGLGNIGPVAALPVMEGKCLLFKEFAGIDAWPVVLATQKVEEIVATVKMIAPGFGGINLEDISAPRCFAVEQKLQNIGIPVFHDDQHGTAIVVLAALLNALIVVGKKLEQIKVVISGAGAAGIAIAKFIKPKKLILIDSKGPVNLKRGDLNPYKREVATMKNYQQVNTFEKAIAEADVFIGVSGKGKLRAQDIKRMREKAIVFALSNPTPEILPDQAKAAGARVVATGRSDFPNQINNVLAFPGIFRGALDVQAKRITERMKLAAAAALAAMTEKPTPDKILPSALDKNVAKVVAKAVSTTA